MTKITFENLPSTNTPLSAENLNLLQTNVENAIGVVQNAVNTVAGQIPTIDSSISTSSTNGVENQAITNYVNNTFVEASDLSTVATSGSYNDLTNKPTIITSTSLYNNSTGSNSTITLSDSIANYDYIEIYYKTNDNDTILSRKFYSINTSSVVCLDFAYDFGGSVYYKVANVTANGTSITFASNLQFTDFGSKTSGDFIFITRVIGYK